MTNKQTFVGVDEDDKALGPITEEECLNGTLHRSVTVVVFNDKNQIAIQKRAMSRKLYPGMYTLSATGHVDWTDNGPEDNETAAKREFDEELGKPAPKLEYKFTTHLNAPGHNIMSAVFTTTDNGPFNPDPKELESLTFLSTKEIEKKADKFTPTAKLNLQKLGII